MNCAQNRHDLSDEQWIILADAIRKRPERRGGSNANDDRTFVNGVFWVMRTGAPWRDLPPQYGKWSSIHKRFKRWCDSGLRN